MFGNRFGLGAPQQPAPQPPQAQPIGGQPFQGGGFPPMGQPLGGQPTSLASLFLPPRQQPARAMGNPMPLQAQGLPPFLQQWQQRQQQQMRPQVQPPSMPPQDQQTMPSIGLQPQKPGFGSALQPSPVSGSQSPFGVMASNVFRG